MKYFDQDFWKFSLGFLVIITISVVMIMITGYFEKNREKGTANVIDSGAVDPAPVLENR